MNELPPLIQKRIDRYLPLETDGVTLYPIKVDRIEDFSRCRMALEFMQQSLPVAMQRIPLLTAFYQIELATSALEQDGEGKAATLFSDAIVLLCLSLRLGDGKEREQLLERVLVITERENPAALIEVRLITDDGGVIVISPAKFARLRRLIAAQNGAKIPSTDANPEIVNAEREIAAQRAAKIIFNHANKVAWVAALSHADEREIYNWPILMFERRAEVLKRTLDYLTVGIGQASGMVSYKDGNPVPSPYYERESEMLPTQDIAAFAGGGAQKAVENGAKLPQ